MQHELEMFVNNINKETAKEGRECKKEVSDCVKVSEF